MLACLQQEHPHLTFELNEGIFTISIQRSNAKNALNGEMYSALANALHEAEYSKKVQVIILRGNDTDFTAGNDMKYFLFAAQSQSDGPVGDTPPFLFLKALALCTKPLIAAIRGCAIGVGVTLLFHCDLVYAEANATFQLPFVNLGLSVEGASSLFMSPLAGYHLASEILLTGQKFDAQKALEARIVNTIVEDAYAHAQKQARIISNLPTASLKIIKRQIQFPRDVVIDCINREAEIVGERVKSLETLEAVTAFLQKRPPNFRQFD